MLITISLLILVYLIMGGVSSVVQTAEVITI